MSQRAGPLFKQETQGSCAVACLRSVLALQFSVRVPERVLRFVGDTATRSLAREGTTWTEWTRMLAAANQARNKGPKWTTWRRRGVSMEGLTAQLSRGRYPVIGITHSELHAIIVLGIQPYTVTVWDPDPGVPPVPLLIDAGEFIARWQHAGAEYDVIGGGTSVPTPPPDVPALPFSWV